MTDLEVILTFTVMLVSFLFSFWLVIKPRKPRIVGLVVGLFGLLFCGLSLTVVGLPFFPWFSASIGLMGVLCMLRAGSGI